MIGRKKHCNFLSPPDQGLPIKALGMKWLVPHKALASKSIKGGWRVQKGDGGERVVQYRKFETHKIHLSQRQEKTLTEKVGGDRKKDRNKQNLSYLSGVIRKTIWCSVDAFIQSTSQSSQALWIKGTLQSQSQTKDRRKGDRLKPMTSICRNIKRKHLQKKVGGETEERICLRGVNRNITLWLFGGCLQL